MSFVQRELDRLQRELAKGEHIPNYDRLYAAAQALAWSLEPTGAKSPFDYIMNPPQFDRFGMPILSDAEIENIAPMPHCEPPREPQ